MGALNNRTISSKDQIAYLEIKLEKQLKRFEKELKKIQSFSKSDNRISEAQEERLSSHRKNAQVILNECRLLVDLMEVIKEASTEYADAGEIFEFQDEILGVTNDLEFPRRPTEPKVIKKEKTGNPFAFLWKAPAKFGSVVPDWKPRAS